MYSYCKDKYVQSIPVNYFILVYVQRGVYVLIQNSARIHTPVRQTQYGKLKVITHIIYLGKILNSSQFTAFGSFGLNRLTTGDMRSGAPTRQAKEMSHGAMPLGSQVIPLANNSRSEHQDSKSWGLGTPRYHPFRITVRDKSSD